MSKNACDGEKSPASGDLSWMLKKGPLETGDFGKIGGFGKNHQSAGNNGDKRPDPSETGDFGENRQRVGDIQNVANIQIGCQKRPLQIR